MRLNHSNLLLMIERAKTLFLQLRTQVFSKVQIRPNLSPSINQKLIQKEEIMQARIRQLQISIEIEDKKIRKNKIIFW